MKYIFLLLTLLPVIASADMCNEPNSDKKIDYLWTAPNERENNDPVTPDKIAGYKIYIGNATGIYPCSITINNGATTSYTLNALGSLNYYAVITTIDTEGRESQYSREDFLAKDEEPPVITDPIKSPSNFTGTKRTDDVPNVGGSL